MKVRIRASELKVKHLFFFTRHFLNIGFSNYDLFEPLYPSLKKENRNNASNRNFPVTSRTGTEPKSKRNWDFCKMENTIPYVVNTGAYVFRRIKDFFFSIFKQYAGKRNVLPANSRHTTYVANVVARPPYAGFVNFSFNGRSYIIYMCMCTNRSDNWCTVCNRRYFF